MAKSKARQGNPHMDPYQKVLDSAWQKKLGKALEAMDKPRTLAKRFWGGKEKLRKQMASKRKRPRPSPHT